LSVNQDLLDLVGGDAPGWQSKSMELLFPMASRIFLQTHVWPMLLRDGRVREIRLQIFDHARTSIPVFVNCQQTTTAEGAVRFTWVLFVTLERSRYEQELLESRQRAEVVSAELAKSERFVRAVADAMPGMIAYWDLQQQCHFANKPYANWRKKSPHELIGMPMATALGQQLYQQNLARIEGVLRGQNQEFEREQELPDGSVSHTLVNYIADKDPNGAVTGFFSLVTDITRLREAAAAIRLSASVFEATTEAILVMDTQAKVVMVNPAFTALTGYPAHEVVGGDAGLLRSDRHDTAFYASILFHLRTKKLWRGEVWTRRKNGTVFLGQLSLSAIADEAGNIVQYVGVCSDITARWDTEQQVRYMAFHDGLTGLPNRTLLMERLGQLVAMAGRESRRVALLFLDLDGFKNVNDTWGHDVGDQVLKTIANRLHGLLRSSDTVARLGGDEFVLMLDNPESHESVALIGERVIATVNEPMQFDAISVRVGTSIGIAIHQNRDESADALIKRADEAMYAAKAGGKNMCCFAPAAG